MRRIAIQTSPLGTRPFHSSMVLRRKLGKPQDTPALKQVYLPYEKEPTKAELERERRRFAKAPGNLPHLRDQTYEVKDVPENMFTYGKEGMSLPISLFKDQPDPIIAAEHTYPGIYENKIACRWKTTYELAQLRSTGFESPFQEIELEERVKDTQMHTAKVMSWMKERGAIAGNVYMEDRKDRRGGSKAAKPKKAK